MQVSSRCSNSPNGYINVTANASQRNISREEIVKYQQHFTINKQDLSLISTAPSVDVSNEYDFVLGIVCLLLLMFILIYRRLKVRSPSLNLTAILREIPDQKSAKKENRQLLEIWRNGFLENSVDLQQFDKHGKIYTDGILIQKQTRKKTIILLTLNLVQMIGTFGCFELSPDEKYLVYLAERKEAKKQSFLTHGIIPRVEGVNMVCVICYSVQFCSVLIIKTFRVMNMNLLKTGESNWWANHSQSSAFSISTLNH